MGVREDMTHICREDTAHPPSRALSTVFEGVRRSKDGRKLLDWVLLDSVEQKHALSRQEKQQVYSTISIDSAQEV